MFGAGNAYCISGTEEGKRSVIPAKESGFHLAHQFIIPSNLKSRLHQEELRLLQFPLGPQLMNGPWILSGYIIN